MVKLIIYALLAYVAWYFVRQFLMGLGAKQAARRPAPERPAEAPRVEAQDLVRCTVCGSYVAGRCARTNCPQ